MKVIIGGDISPQKHLQSILKFRDFDRTFGELKYIFDENQFSIVNFETTIPLKEEKAINKEGPALSSTENIIDALQWLGVDVVTLANNHACDFGLPSLNYTRQLLEHAKIKTVGASSDPKEASETLYLRDGNEILAIINCCEHEYGFATDNEGGTNPLDPIKQYNKIVEAKKNADYVLVIVHGGHENFQLPSIRMQDTYRFFIDVGADAVINHHQHCFSGMERYTGKPIFYGLGNLAFDTLWSRPHPLWYEGLLVKLEFSQKGVNFSYIPYTQFKESDTIEIIKDRTSFDKRFNELSEIIVDRERLNIELMKFYSKGEKEIRAALQPFQNKLYLAAYYKGLIPSLISKRALSWLRNHIVCEAHRDKLVSFLLSHQ